MIITPHYSDEGATLNHQAIADALVADFNSFLGGGNLIHVSIYRDGQPEPNYPIATAASSTGTPITSAAARELALCVSFYSDFNRPRQRGRVYIPLSWIHKKNAGSGVGLRPTAQEMTDAKSFMGQFNTTVKAQNARWCVYSKVANVARVATHYYCDDEWDIQRRRGLVPTTRTITPVP
jgi:hypothetical protein